MEKTTSDEGEAELFPKRTDAAMNNITDNVDDREVSNIQSDLSTKVGEVTQRSLGKSDICLSWDTSGVGDRESTSQDVGFGQEECSELGWSSSSKFGK